MSVILFPFKIIGAPLNLFFGLFGLFIAALINAIICRQVLCVLAWNNAWHQVNHTALNITMLAAFILTFFAVLSK